MDIQTWYANKFDQVYAIDLLRWSENINSATDCKSVAFRECLTATRYNQLKNGIITLEQAKEYALKRKTAEVRKRCEAEKVNVSKWLAEPNVASVEVMVSWKNHKPSADVSVHLADGQVERYEGKAGGWGYDLESAAVAQALNQCGAIRKLLIEAKFNKREAGQKNHDILGYGSGYGIIPHFEGGVGITSHKGIFENLGFKVGGMSGKTYDLYTFSR